MAGPLKGLTIIEMAGIGPAPFAGMMLADHGAEVIRIEREGLIGIPNDPLLRSRRSIALDLKQERGREAVRKLAARADGLIEGYRPGVMERLGLGPDDLLRDNPRLVFGRVTGWGQQGRLSGAAGHDIVISQSRGCCTASVRRRGRWSQSTISPTSRAAG